MIAAGRLKILALAAVAAAALAAIPASPSALAADAPTPGRGPGGGADLESLSEAVAPAIVTLKVVYTWSDGEEEDTWWSHGAVVDPTGLVVLGYATDSDGKVKVKSIHVLFGTDPKEWPAVVVAKDSVLGLSWVQVLGVEGKALVHVDLAKGAASEDGPPRLGQPLFGVTRLGRGFDYAPSARRLYFTSKIESPRRMWDFTGDFGEAGLPVFDYTGRPVAVLAEQASAEGASEQGGQSSETFALPLDIVLKSLEKAKSRVPEAMKKAAGAATEAPKDPAKDGGKDGGKPATPEPPKAPDAPK